MKLITLNIGSNDELASISECENSGTEYAQDRQKQIRLEPGRSGHELHRRYGGEQNVPAHPHNLGEILGAIDSTEPGGGHYTGAIVLVGFYNPDAFILPGSDELQKGLNAAVEANILPAFPNVTFANPFPKFNGEVEQTAKEKKNIDKYTEMCNPNVQKPSTGNDPGEGDIHPSLAGYKLLAKLTNEAYLVNPAK